MRPWYPVVVSAEVRAFRIDSSTASAIASNNGSIWWLGIIWTPIGWPVLASPAPIEPCVGWFPVEKARKMSPEPL